MRIARFKQATVAALAVAAGMAHAQAGATAVYRCPGPPVLYTDAISAQEARDRGCRTIEGAPITVVQGVSRPAKPAAASAGVGAGTAAAPPASRPSDARVAPQEQRARDSDAKRILEAELRREEDRMAGMLKDFNNGEPERRGDERNAQKYLDRVADMKAALSRKEADIAALRRELQKLP